MNKDLKVMSNKHGKKPEIMADFFPNEIPA
jgi:hypothetical protein